MPFKQPAGLSGSSCNSRIVDDALFGTAILSADIVVHFVRNGAKRGRVVKQSVLATDDGVHCLLYQIYGHCVAGLDRGDAVFHNRSFERGSHS